MMILLILSITQFELDATESYNRGNEYFLQGRYSEAIAAYEQALQMVRSAGIHYNLGNAYFKKGMLGKSVLHYRVAHFLAPRDQDITHNLEFVRNYRVDKVQLAASPLISILDALFHYFSLYETQILTTFFFVAASVLLSLHLIFRIRVFGYAAITAAVLCIFFFINWQVWLGEKTGRHAVVTGPEVSVLSGPADDYKVIILLHDGAEAWIRETRNGYALIQLSGGIGGWVTEAALEEIF
ncbi:tetratricopeptide repeat protein [candidate division WOR-3 bacterium]|nr:tetratricopeptide repeat protein [candidate division WOR-3 bacterium]